MSTAPLRLITLPISHYCEKVRWALDRQGLAYQEEGLVPMLHMATTLRVTRGRSRSVPILVDGDQVLADSTDCLRYLHERRGATWLYSHPEASELEELFDTKLGPHTRRWVYFYLLPEGTLAQRLLTWRVSTAQATALRVLFPVIRRLMQKGMNIHAESAERSRQHIDEVFTRVSQRLADGRRYLCGDHFTAADLAFVSLASPVVLTGRPGMDPLDPSLMPAAMRQEVERLRATSAGAFAQRVYREERERRA